MLVFPSAGGDAEEIERHGLVDACGSLLAEGQIKLYSVDSVAGRAMVAKEGSVEHRMWLLNQFHECVRWEVLPALWADLGGQSLDVVTAGASIGAFNAVAMLCRYPDVFGAAIGMSGTYRIERFYDEAWSQDLYFAAPLQFLPGLEGPAAGPAAVSPGSAGRRRGRVGGHRRVLADGRCARGQGDPEPGGQLGTAVGAPVAHVAFDASAVPARAG